MLLDICWIIINILLKLSNNNDKVQKKNIIVSCRNMYLYVEIENNTNFIIQLLIDINYKHSFLSRYLSSSYYLFKVIIRFETNW